MKRLLTEIDCGRIKKINKVYLRKFPKIKYNEMNGELITLKHSPEEIIPLNNYVKKINFETDETNLQKVFQIKEVYYKRTISNDIMKYITC